MREIRLFELDQRQTVLWHSPAGELPQTLQVLQGLLWLTVEGEHTDHWLRAGESFEMRAGQRIWLGTWDDGARLRVSQPAKTVMTSAGTRVVHTARAGWRLVSRGMAARVANRAVARLSRG
ncbi:DUF2917 domain-containing protein [Pandoraea nosoerga]|uniref:DUF2917 domain-containing protein n=1 Tax=Pandoraea nosoerga TaxID=2508296 RepID=A0A5E4TLC7_9BURK|nr:DUF2917 domain-containing protein [Pandoraea nosoerga]MBN4665566.1 DUF2917 domain-containing protein [Pandoraea nosoerga]MBN4675091.1 DUF2917 domain-containing protein [Pandoraea nosoerga]MBN4680407.1 DUF2917 domain-containing protein [Pandoraea nosoerga]MBN4745515.1 DUF2917 domain-containing protein [Pandoraea nosoerga]VVD88796.1 hypothetical protein PNO31109_01496 [Pandoraea nosoerga]